MTFSCRVQRKTRDRKKFSILMHNLSTAKVFGEWSRNRGGVAQKIPIKSIMFAIDSSGVDIDRTINLASGKSVISLI